MVRQSILVISDMHHPYAHKDTHRFLKALQKKYRFTDVVCIGDEIDAHALTSTILIFPQQRMSFVRQ